jgi:hypothetical protein
MNQKSVTKDEQFLMQLHKVAGETGDLYAEFDRFAIGKAIGESERVINNIVRHLAQANFLKKGDGDSVYLTDNGIRLVEELLAQNPKR